MKKSTKILFFISIPVAVVLIFLALSISGNSGYSGPEYVFNISCDLPDELDLSNYERMDDPPLVWNGYNIIYGDQVEDFAERFGGTVVGNYTACKDSLVNIEYDVIPLAMPQSP